MSSLILDSDVKKFWEDGYLVIKNVFTKEEIDAFRRTAYEIKADYASRGLTYPSQLGNFDIIQGDLLSKKGLNKVILDERLRSIATKILGGPIVYFGDSTFQIGEGARGYHKDNADRTNPQALDWQGRYSIIRFGIYLQDHKFNSGGLKVRKGSHNYISTSKGKSILVPSEAGDAVVWSLRTTHSGNVVRLKGFPNLSIHTELEKRIPRWMRVDEQKERISMFLSFGLKDDPKTAHFMDFLKKQSWAILCFKSSPVSSDTWDEIRKRGIEVVKVIPEYGE